MNCLHVHILVFNLYSKLSLVSPDTTCMNPNLDPHTISPVLTKENHKVIRGPQNTTQDEMFPPVLCTERYSSGKYCWEVEVENSWCVGVCSTTAKREPSIPLTPQNWFWVLQYDGTKLYFGTEQLRLPNAKELAKLGVFLDCDKHTLLFYDVDTSVICFINSLPKCTFIPVISPGSKGSGKVRLS